MNITEKTNNTINALAVSKKIDVVTNLKKVGGVVLTNQECEDLSKTLQLSVDSKSLPVSIPNSYLFQNPTKPLIFCISESPLNILEQQKMAYQKGIEAKIDDNKGSDYRAESGVYGEAFVHILKTGEVTYNPSVYSQIDLSKSQGDMFTVNSRDEVKTTNLLSSNSHCLFNNDIYRNEHIVSYCFIDSLPEEVKIRVPKLKDYDILVIHFGVLTPKIFNKNRKSCKKYPHNDSKVCLSPEIYKNLVSFQEYYDTEKHEKHKMCSLLHIYNGASNADMLRLSFILSTHTLQQSQSLSSLVHDIPSLSSLSFRNPLKNYKSKNAKGLLPTFEVLNREKQNKMQYVFSGYNLNELYTFCLNLPNAKTSLKAMRNQESNGFTNIILSLGKKSLNIDSIITESIGYLKDRDDDVYEGYIDSLHNSQKEMPIISTNMRGIWGSIQKNYGRSIDGSSIRERNVVYTDLQDICTSLYPLETYGIYESTSSNYYNLNTNWKCDMFMPIVKKLFSDNSKTGGLTYKQVEIDIKALISNIENLIKEIEQIKSNDIRVSNFISYLKAIPFLFIFSVILYKVLGTNYHSNQRTLISSYSHYIETPYGMFDYSEALTKYAKEKIYPKLFFNYNVKYSMDELGDFSGFEGIKDSEEVKSFDGMKKIEDLKNNAMDEEEIGDVSVNKSVTVNINDNNTDKSDTIPPMTFGENPTSFGENSTSIIKHLESEPHEFSHPADYKSSPLDNNEDSPCYQGKSDNIVVEDTNNVEVTGKDLDNLGDEPIASSDEVVDDVIDVEESNENNHFGPNIPVPCISNFTDNVEVPNISDIFNTQSSNKSVCIGNENLETSKVKLKTPCDVVSLILNTSRNKTLLEQGFNKEQIEGLIESDYMTLEKVKENLLIEIALNSNLSFLLTLYKEFIKNL